MELPITDIKAPAGAKGMEKGVSGILGMDFLQRFDVKLDFQTGALFAVCDPKLLPLPPQKNPYKLPRISSGQRCVSEANVPC